MLRSLLLQGFCAVALGGSLTVSSSDLAGGKPSLDNVKASWDTDLTLAGKKAKLSLLYDLKAQRNFVKEAKLSGALEEVKYVLTHTFKSRVTGLTLATKQGGVLLKAVGDSKNQLTQVSASGNADVGGITVGVSPAFLLKSKRSKLALMADVGGGASVTGELSASASGDVEISDYALEYETSIGKDRDLSASVHPANSALDLQVVDRGIESGATWVANLHSSIGKSARPQVSVRRAMSF